MRLGFFLREALRALRATPCRASPRWPPCSSPCSCSASSSRRAGDHRRGQRGPRRACSPTSTSRRDAKPADVDARARPARSRRRRRTSAASQFISKEQALRRAASARQPGGLRPARLQPAARHLPRHAATSPDNIAKIRDALAPLSPGGGRTVIDPAIDEVRNREEDTNKILSATRVVKLTMALLAVLLVRRLDPADRQHDPAVALRAPPRGRGDEARRRDRLVHPLAVRASRACCVGALGGVLAVLLLGVVKIALRRPAGGGVRADRGAGHDQLRAADRRAARGASVAVSALGSGLSLRRFLRV